MRIHYWPLLIPIYIYTLSTKCIIIATQRTSTLPHLIRTRARNYYLDPPSNPATTYRIFYTTKIVYNCSQSLYSILCRIYWLLMNALLNFLRLLLGYYLTLLLNCARSHHIMSLLYIAAFRSCYSCSASIDI